MSSPVIKILQGIIQIDKTVITPIYLQLAQQIIQAIQREYISEGTKLPGTRILADYFQIHRKTVVATYDELYAQGWIEIIPNKGSFILKQMPKISNRNIKKKKESYDIRLIENHEPEIQDNIILHRIQEESDLPLQISEGTIDLRLVDIRQLVHYYSAVSKRPYIWNAITKNFGKTPTFFVDQLCTYINLTRGLHIEKKQLLIAAQKQTLLYATLRAIIRPNDTVIVGELSDPHVNMMYKQCGANLETIPVDEHGIDIHSLSKILRRYSIRAIHIQPQHHYPTTAILSTERRMQLLHLATEYKFIIIEDEDWVELTYEKLYPLPLAASDLKNHIVYLSGIARHLPISHQIAFCVAPNPIKIQIANQLALIQPLMDPLMQYTLAELIHEGEIHRGLKKNIKVYTDRRNHCCAQLISTLGKYIEIDIPKNGLAIWVKIIPHISLIQLKLAAEKFGLFIPKHLLFQNKSTTAIRWGFAEHNKEEMNERIDLLNKALQTLIKT